MAKKKEYTFADEAKQIAKRFPKREFDTIEARDYRQAMQNLMKQQEAARGSMGLNNNEQSFADGGPMTAKEKLQAYYKSQAQKGADAANKAKSNFAKDYMAPAAIAAGTMAFPAMAVASPELASITAGIGYKAVLDKAAELQGKPKPLNKLFKRDKDKEKFADGGNVFNKELLDYDREQPYNLYNKTTTDRHGSNAPVTIKSYMFDGFQPVGAATASAIQAQSTIPHPQIATPNTYRNSPLRWENTRPEGIVANNITGVGLGNPGAVDTSTLAPMNTLSSEQIRDLNKQADAATPFGIKVGDMFRNIDVNPSIIGGASNILGNLLLSNMAKRNQPELSPVYGKAQHINLEPKAEQFRKDATVSKNVAMRNARNLGTNAGTTLANVGSIGADVDRNLGSMLTDLYLNQEQFNVGADNQMNLNNVNTANRTAAANFGMDAQTLQDRMGYIAEALKTPQGVLRDMQMQKMDKETLQMYNNILPLLGRNYELMGSLMNGVTRKVR